MIIKEIDCFSEQIYSEILSLLKQLTNNKFIFSNNDFESIIKCDNSFLIGAFQKNNLIGILAFVIYHIPTGKHGRIEDVVVDTAYRGKGIGEKLLLKAIKIGKSMNLDKIFLTSNPNRIAANNLYPKIGFQLGETNSYFYTYKK